MTRPSDRLIGRVSAIGIVVILSMGSWMTGVQGMLPDHTTTEPQKPAARPFSERMGCPPWADGLSRSITIIAHEDESGALLGMQCVRTRDRGVVRKTM